MKPGDERGFIHKRLFGVGKSLLGLGTNLLPGPIGGVARTLLTPVLGSGGGQRQVRRQQLPAGSRTQFPTPGFGGRVKRFLPGGGTGFTTIPRSLLPRLPESGPMGQNRAVGIAPQDSVRAALEAHGDGACPRGFHLNKSAYCLRDGTFVEKGTRLVKNRRLNEANGRANNRSIRRLERAQGQAKKILKATGWRTISKQSSREMRTSRKAACK